MTTDFSLMDIMGNYTGFPVAPDTTSDTATTATTQVSETPAASKTYINPRLALKTQPVAPTEGGTTYDRMLQAESGNRDFDAQGRPITSPKGAMFAGQVMPTTAASPGFGIKPAASQTPEEYNRVGQEYYQAMLKKFGGNEQAAIAAYNAGPGRIQQNLAANQGQLNVAQLPRETQGYLGKVLKGVGNVVEGMIPSAQAGTLPPQPAAAPAVSQTETAINPETGETYQRLVGTAPAAAPKYGVPQAVPGEGVAVATGQGVQGSQEIMGPTSPEESERQAQLAGQELQPYAKAYTGQGLKFGGMPTPQQVQQQKDYNSVLNSNSQEGIAKLAFALDTPKEVQRAALDKLTNTMAVEQGMAKAQAVADKLGTNPTPQALNRAMNDKDTGSYFKVLMYQALGWVSKAKEELNKIDPSVSYNGVSLGNQNYNVKYNKDTGQVMAAWDSQGQMITDPARLGEIAAGGVNPSNAKSFLMPQTLGSPVTKTIDGKLVNGIQIYDPVAKKSYVQYGNQRDENPQGWTSPTQNIEQQGTLLRNKLMEQLRFVTPTERAKKAAQFDQEFSTNTGEQLRREFPEFFGGAPAPVGQQQPPVGQAPVGQAPVGQAPVGQPPAPAGQQQPPVGQAPAGQGPQTQFAGMTPQQMAAAGASPAQITSELSKRKEAEKAQREIDTALIKERDQANQKYSTQLAESYRTAPAQLATINRVQDAIDKNPEFFGIVSDSPAMQAFVNAQSDEKKAEALSKLYTELNIPPSKRAKFDSVVNDYRNLAVSAVTNSGLTASQTNTERESQRVMGTVGSMTDKPAAAKAALEYAKAKVEYQAAKAKSWATERKINRGIDQLDFEVNFDATQGEKIFENANKRMEKIIGGTQSTAPAGGTPKEGDKSTSASGKPIVWRNNRWEYQ